MTRSIRLWGLLAGLCLGYTANAFAAPDTIRVRIMHGKKSVVIACSGAYETMPLDGGQVVPQHGALTVKGAFGSHLSIGGQTMGTEILFSPVSPNDVLAINGRRYRGVLIVEWQSHRKFDVIEQANLDDYLYGVLPKEVGGNWPIESLKAQAVVSRTYALSNKATDPAQRFDVSNDVYSQVYGGLDSEAPLANRAVDETRGQFLATPEGKPIEAFFHSSCGGETELPEAVWPRHGPSDMFTSVSDTFCQADPFYHWVLSISASTLRARLRHAGIRVGDITKIKAAKKSPSGRVTVFAVYSSNKSVNVQGNRFRMAVGPEALRSTLLTMIDHSGHTFRFEGHGWGHGVGLCQWGARGRATAGQTYDQILTAYYPRAKLIRVDAPAPATAP